MPRDEELPIIRAFYDFMLWLNPKIAKFPRDQRFVLGERMERQLYEVLENLIRAKYMRSRKAILDQVNLDLEILSVIRQASSLPTSTSTRWTTSSRSGFDVAITSDTAMIS